jgi:hypothetical protein
MSFIGTFYTWVNAQTWAPDISFDVKEKNPPDPYYTLSPVADAGSTGEFCGSDSGQTIIRFDGYGTDKVTLFDAMDALRKNVIKARNAIAGYTLWHVHATGVIGFQTEDVRIYRYTFDLETMWRG